MCCVCVKVTSQAVLVMLCKVLLLFLLLVPIDTGHSSDMDAFGLSVPVPTRLVADCQCLAFLFMHVGLVGNAVAPVASTLLLLQACRTFMEQADKDQCGYMDAQVLPYGQNSC